jgi:hypothetical protein
MKTGIGGITSPFLLPGLDEGKYNKRQSSLTHVQSYHAQKETSEVTSILSPEVRQRQPKE